MPLSGFVGLTQYLKTRWSPLQVIKGDQLRKRPMAKMSRALLNTFFRKTGLPAASSLGITNAMALPTAKRKKGKTRSVGVQPCQGACSKGVYICAQLPGLFTSIINATVAPRKTSRE